jgi:hypothetical protein
MKNERVLVIGDLHIPYEHKDAFAFLRAIKKKYKPDRVVNIGDETDQHAQSYHEHDPDLYSAGHEMDISEPRLHELEEMFPEMAIIESNHGSLVQRKRFSNGTPARVIKSYNEIWRVGKGWKWVFDLTIPIPGGHCYFHHGKTADVMKLSQSMGMSAVQGHYHEIFGARYWGNPLGLYFAAQTGCLIDWKARAFAYGKNNLKRPVLGSLMILDGKALPIPMLLDSTGRWNGQV